VGRGEDGMGWTYMNITQYLMEYLPGSAIVKSTREGAFAVDTSTENGYGDGSARVL